MIAAGALDGIRVLDLTRVLGGPYCTQMLGDHGADVLKVEPPGGDETRGWGPPFHDGMASYYLGTNRNKRSIVVDMTSAEGRAQVTSLLTDADVLVENFKPGTMEKWGLGYAEVLSAKFPRLIHCCISGFGGSGPLGGLPGYDAAIQAAAGLMSINGDPSGPPTRIGVPIVDLVTGLNAMIGILLALHERQASGRGQSIDVSLYDCAVSVLHPYTANYLYSGKVPRQTGNAHPNISPYDSYATGTAPIFLAVGNDGQFRKLVSFLGKPQLADDRRFLKNSDRIASRDALKAELEALMADKDGLQLADDLMRAGVPCGPVRTIDQTLAHPHTKHRDMLVEIEDYRGIGSPLKLSRNKPRYRRKPPKLGQDNGEGWKSDERGAGIRDEAPESDGCARPRADRGVQR
jgi:crotonobetainyl-CoA:carnitine CoA-transferase CaiB-like acyl-CoA transferase